MSDDDNINNSTKFELSLPDIQQSPKRNTDRVSTEVKSKKSSNEHKSKHNRTEQSIENNVVEKVVEQQDDMCHVDEHYEDSQIGNDEKSQIENHEEILPMENNEDEHVDVFEKQENNNVDNEDSDKTTTQQDTDGISVVFEKPPKVPTKKQTDNESEYASKYENITIGSKKNNVKNNTPIKDTDSMNTNVITLPNMETMKHIDNYTCEHLRKIAKKMSIPIMHKDDNGRRQLKKNELYDKIMEHLSNK